MVAVMVAMAPNAFAVPIITQDGTSNGNPGGLPIYVVSNLVEGDSFNVDWFFDEAEGGDESLFDIVATGMVTVTTLTDDQLVIDIMMLTNNSDAGHNVRITVFGLSVEGFSARPMISTILTPVGIFSNLPMLLISPASRTSLSALRRETIVPVAVAVASWLGRVTRSRST
jgi:hypothetical protein